MRAVIYCRVSTDAQERDGTSLDTQERACVSHAEMAGWSVIECMRDTASGFSLDRSGLSRMRAQLRLGLVDVVLAYAVDRLSRNQSHIGVLLDEVESHGVRLEFVTEEFEQTAVGKFILNARGFVAEIEREKILERTSRGKLERARSGRLPQATGRGLYGYRYNRTTGKREVDEYQATVVGRAFATYSETRSFSAVCNMLNEVGITALAGGRWYPLTIRNMLTNDAYIGRTYYRRRQRVRGGKGRSGYRVVDRPIEDHVEIPDATPAIVDRDTWERVQSIIRDPERIARKPAGRHYDLASRIRCGLCGSAMVGQTLTNKGKPYRYYRCRHSYDKNSGRQCEGRYIRADELETSVWSEVRRVLTNPSIVMEELRQLKATEVPAEETDRVERAIRELTEREGRLMELYLDGSFSKATLDEEALAIRRKRALLEDQLRTLRGPLHELVDTTDEGRLSAICLGIASWLASAGPEERVKVLEALQLKVDATRSAVKISGSIPSYAPEFITIEQTSASFQSDKGGTPFWSVLVQ